MAKGKQNNPNKPATGATKPVESSEAKADEDTKVRSNPNAPISEADKQKALQNVADATGTASIRDSLPDDVEQLKDQLAAALETGAKADEEIAQLQHESVQNRKMVEDYPKLKQALANKVAAGEEQFKPILGMHNAEHGIEVIGAPIGNTTKPRELMSVVLQNGKYVGFGISSVKLAISNIDGYWKIK